MEYYRNKIIWNANYNFIQMMEHQRKRRGISLIKHQRTHSIPPPDTNRTPLTHFHYSRYAGPQMMTRYTSAPKTQVSFSYSTQPPASLVPTSLQLPRQSPSFDTSKVEKVLTPKIAISQPQTKIISEPQKQTPEIERYFSFEHCKEVIGNKLFGQSPSRKDASHKKENIVESSSGQKQQNAPEPKICPFNEIVAMPLELTSKLNCPQDEEKQKDVSKTKTKNLTQENIENIKIEPQQKDPVKVRKMKRNPLNLVDMEKRLHQIIKICDQAL